MKKETFCRYIRQYETDMFRFAKSIVGTQADGEILIHYVQEENSKHGSFRSWQMNVIRS